MVKVVILDFGFGNLLELKQTLVSIGASVEVTCDFDSSLNADGLVVPGEGSLSLNFAAIKSIRGDQIIERRLAGGRAILAVCGGMHLLFEGSVEKRTNNANTGLAQWPGLVEPLSQDNLPHWQSPRLVTPDASKMFAGLGYLKFYFDHNQVVRSWKLTPNEVLAAPLVTWANYPQEFVAAVENGPLWATQFHPEKSDDAGLQLLANWVKQF